MKKTTFYKKMRYAMRKTAEAWRDTCWGFDAKECPKWLWLSMWILLFPFVVLVIGIAVINCFIDSYKWAGWLREYNYEKYLMEVL